MQEQELGNCKGAIQSAVQNAHFIHDALVKQTAKKIDLVKRINTAYDRLEDLLRRLGNYNGLNVCFIIFYF